LQIVRQDYFFVSSRSRDTSFSRDWSSGVCSSDLYRPRNGAALGDLGEVERIEVRKGPQATLFGKNTSAGVINVVTAAPSFDARMAGEATFGDYGTHGGSVSLTGPFVDEVLAGRRSEEHTSELQSREKLVCRLLLEKKK